MSAHTLIAEVAFPIARTRGGALFDPNQTRWVICEGHVSVSLNFSRLLRCATEKFVRSFQMTLIWYAENRSLRHLENMFKRADHLFSYLTERRPEKLLEISATDILDYQSARGVKDYWYLSSLAGFLKKWVALGYSGVTSDVVSLLSELKLRGNKKGAAVLTLDPIDGPFTDIERESIHIALNSAYASGSVSIEDFLLCSLFSMLGQRPSQYALLKILDFSVSLAVDGSRIYCLKVPRVKQRKADRLEFKERLLTPQIGELLFQYAEEVKNSFQLKLHNPLQAPLFPSGSTGRQPPGMEYHQDAGVIGSRLARTLARLQVFSERTGAEIHITATRFRRTLGTTAAREGHGELVIAELLDHSNTQNVGVYVQSSPEIIERIDKAVALHLAPLAQAFAGVVIADETAAIRGNDPSSRLFDPRIEESALPVGSCGSFGFCGFLAPIACYSCQFFQAWLDGPHEGVLEFLIAERERKMKLADMRIASVNDRTILAVAEVVLQCKAIKASNLEKTSG